MNVSLRIGELARRTGTTPELLRAWERRYGVLHPTRSKGGFRLYGPGDEARVRRMRALIAEGLSAAQAAGIALEELPGNVGGPAGPLLPELVGRLEVGIDRFDEQEANDALDALLGAFTPETVFVEALVPFLRRLGERWAAGDTTVGHEHFASGVIRGRVMSMARGWGRGAGPVALLACPPGEQHDLPLIMFGVVLHRKGWGIAYLGADTPIETVADSARSLSPRIVVLAAVEPERFLAVSDSVADLGSAVPVAVAGGGASSDLAERLGARWLEGDVVAAADALDLSASPTVGG